MVGAPDVYANEEMFGSQTGRALQQSAQAIDGIAAVIDKRRQQSREEDAASIIANSDYSKRDLDRRNAAAPGAPDFYRSTGVDYDNWVNEQTNSIQDDWTRRTVKETLLRRKPGVMQNAAQFEIASMESKSKTEANDGLSNVINRVRSDPTAYDQALTDGDNVIASRTGIAEGDKFVMQQKFRQGLVQARFDSMRDSATTIEGIDAVEKELRDKKWADQFDSAEYDRQLNAIDAARTSITSGTRAEITASLEDFKSRSNDPTTLIDPQELRDLEKKVEKYGSDKQIRDYYAVVKRQEVYRDEGKLPPHEIQARRDKAETGFKGRASPDEARAMQLYISNGLTAEQAGGIVGNLVWEAGGRLNPNAINSGDGRDGSDSIGIGQWNGKRAQALKTFAASRNKPWNDLETQLLFVLHELNGTEGQAFSVLKRARTADEAASAFVGYERPKGWSEKDPENAHGWENRVAHARRLSGSAAGAAPGAYVENQARDDLLRLKRDVLKNNMMKDGNDTGLIQLAPLDPSDPQSFVTRGMQALKVAENNGITYENMTPLTTDEVTQMSQTISSGTIDDKLAVMTSLMSMNRDVARAAFKQLGQTDKVFEHAAGVAMAGAPDVAAEVVRGRTRLTDDKQLKETFATRDYANAFDAIVKGSLNGVPPDRVQAIRDAALAHYAETYVARGPDRAVSGVAPDSAALERSVDAVLGGRPGGSRIGTVNGETTILPQGVNEDTFEAALDNMSTVDYARLSATGQPPVYADGTLVTPDEIAREGRFKAVGNNKYMIQMGGDDYLLTEPPRTGTAPTPYVFVADPNELWWIVSANAPAGTDRLRGGLRARQNAARNM